MPGPPTMTSQPTTGSCSKAPRFTFTLPRTSCVRAGIVLRPSGPATTRVVGGVAYSTCLSACFNEVWPLTSRAASVALRPAPAGVAGASLRVGSAGTAAGCLTTPSRRPRRLQQRPPPRRRRRVACRRGSPPFNALLQRAQDPALPSLPVSSWPPLRFRDPLTLHISQRSLLEKVSCRCLLPPARRVQPPKRAWRRSAI